MTTRTAAVSPPAERAAAELAPPGTLPASSAAARHRASARPHDQPILSIRASVPEPDADAFVADALHDIRAYMQDHHLRPAGPPFSIRRPHGSEIDIEAGWPTAAPLPGTGRIHGGALPRTLLEPETGPNTP